MATVKELKTRLDDLEARHACAEKLIIGLIAELDKAQGRITSLENLAADFVQEIELDEQAAEEAAEAIRGFLGSVQIITDGVAREVAGAFGLKL
ncbi:hypothetical protein L8P30_09885 [Enterobacter asburiae]|uniref:hypothetical protein n=1 Tax=Enterobacter asburiae TaxID=61645 RepID=UPI00200444EB|nr:hypothetical protein [Enterobacter asburiae]MCK7142560.1 hypothetical protein [Enterobacter asburiae]